MPKGKPPLLNLRERIAELMREIPEAGVQGTGKELVPVEPPQPSGPELTEDQMARLVQGLEEGNLQLDEMLANMGMSRRGFLEGLASSLLPIPDPLTLAAKELKAPTVSPTTLAKAAPVASAPTISKALMADRLGEAWDYIFETSEFDPGFFDAAIAALEELPETPAIQNLRQRVSEVLENWDNSDLDEPLPEDFTLLKTVFDEAAKEQGIMKLDPDATDEPTRFVEPPTGGTEVLLDALASAKAYGDAQEVRDLERLIEYLGPRADVIFARDYMTRDGSTELEQALKDLDLDIGIIDSWVDQAETLFGDYRGSLEDWTRAPAELREAYRQARAEWGSLGQDGWGSPEERAAEDKLREIERKIWPKSLYDED